MPTWISILLCLALILSLPCTVQAKEKTEDKKEIKTIAIETAEEFLSFAENCRLDTYSVNLKVELEDDINLTGKEFKAIPTFSGEFNGNDHVIRGLSLEAEGSVQGLFRYVRAGAVIKNLHLEGNIKPTGSRSSVGSLAGENAGTIENCSFSGSIAGSDRVGGLVGYNALTGVIEACTVSGQIQGHHFVGGLAGENNGVIRQSYNEASINTAVQDNAVGIGDISLESVLESESAVTVTDVGGIAGANMGVIRDCENLGGIGYAKIGYNMGGIAGSQSGYIVDCVNYGQIQGRKEVGGIVGQMKPTMRMEFDEDTLQKLQVEMDTMMGLTGQTMSSAQGSVAGVSGQISALEGYVKDAQNALDQMTPEVMLPEDPAYGNGTVDIPKVDVPDLDTVLAAQNNLSSSLGQIPGTVDDMVASAKGTLGAISSSMQALSNQMTVISNTVKNADEDMGGSIVDASDADTVEDIGGKVQDCLNTGTVTGDLNVGGIAGAISFESSWDPELDVAVSGDLSMNFEGEVRAVVLDCHNEAVVTTYKQNGGGIVGRMSLGLVRSCENRGALKGAAAVYLGGIAGRSDGGYIRKNMTRCAMEGAEYVGGIAGTAVVVSDCYSITKFESAAEKNGGVLGGIDEINEDIKGNYYLPVEGDIGGIDGISYENGAQAMEAEQFFALEQLPEDYQKVTVRFIQEDNNTDPVIATVTVDFGAALPTEKIPAVPEKDGGSGHWEGLQDLDLSALYYDVSFKAVYDAYETVVASELQRADGRPILLAGSDFGKDAAVQMEELTAGPISVDTNESIAEAWSFGLEAAGSSVKLRYLPPEDLNASELLEDEARVMVRDSTGAWRNVSYIVDGSYLVFEILEEDIGFCLVQQEAVSWVLFTLGGGAVLLLTGAVIITLVIKRRRKVQKTVE